jgi:hypothetical protein
MKFGMRPLTKDVGRFYLVSICLAFLWYNKLSECNTISQLSKAGRGEGWWLMLSDVHLTLSVCFSKVSECV